MESVVEFEREPLVAAQTELDPGTHVRVIARLDPRLWAGRHDRHRRADDRERGVGWCDPPPRPGRLGGVVAVHEQLFEEVTGHCMRRKLGATDPGDRVPWRVFPQ